MPAAAEAAMDAALTARSGLLLTTWQRKRSSPLVSEDTPRRLRTVVCRARELLPLMSLFFLLPSVLGREAVLAARRRRPQLPTPKPSLLDNFKISIKIYSKSRNAVKRVAIKGCEKVLKKRVISYYRPKARPGEEASATEGGISKV